jgi:predicted nucleic acid-binding protein
VALELTVVDTTVIIDLLRGHEPAREWAVTLERRLVASEMSRIETLRGMRSAEREAVERAFRIFRWIPVDESIARRAGILGRRWRASHPGIALADLAVAATTQELGADLATSNVRHFPMFPGLRPTY